MAREINLVPDIKNEMIKTLKLRNFIFFLCMVVAAAGIGVTFVFGMIAGGQQLVVNNNNAFINDVLSKKLEEFSDLGDFLTIKDQLSNISALTEDKNVFSRTFDILSTILPSGADTITISELNVDLSGEAPTFDFDAQANAGQEPFIDYNVLDSFKKSMDFMRYDYGEYVDKYGQTIPSYCMLESDASGATFNDSGRIYAYWTIDAEGCNPSSSSSSDSTASNAASGTTSGSTSNASSNTTSGTSSSTSSAYTYEDYNGTKVVRIWRTPLYDEWYSKKYLSLDGAISGVEHFESSCYTYSGTASQNGDKPKWTEDNSCNLVPGGVEGITIASGSSNGRDSSGELVLRFSASIEFAPEFYSFNNHHMLAIAPSGHRNVTDSYRQIQAMFGERASDCAADDVACGTTNNANNTNGTSNNSNGSTSNSTNGNSSNSSSKNTNTNGGK